MVPPAPPVPTPMHCKYVRSNSALHKSTVPCDNMIVPVLLTGAGASSPATAQPPQSVSSGEPARTAKPSDKPLKEQDKAPDKKEEDKPEKVKQFWQKRQSSQSSDPAAVKSKASAPTDHKSKPAKENPPAPKDARTKRHKSASPAPESSLPKKKPPNVEDLQSPKKQPSSPKWFHFHRKNQTQRSRSESPERPAKKTGRQEAKEKTEHPLEVAASRAEPSKPTEEQRVLEESQTNVLDRIRQYNINDAAVTKDRAAAAPQAKGADSKADPKDSKGKPKEEAKAKGKEKEKEKSKKKAKEEGHVAKSKEKAKEDDKKKKSTKKEATTSSWNPFKKSKKDTKEDAGKKSKKVKDAMKSDQPPQAGATGAQVEFSNVKSRIEKLKELGLETDGTDDPDVVLLSVVQQEDGEGERDSEAGIGEDDEDRELTEDETSGEEDGAEEEANETEDQVQGPEVQLEIRVSTSPDSSVPSPEPPASAEEDSTDKIAVMDRVKKLQLMQRSPVVIKRTRSYTDAKK